MKRSLKGVFGISVLVVSYALCAIVVLLRHVPSPGGEPKVLRIAHARLEPGAREALRAVGDSYEALNPGIRVEFLAVPERQYAVWLNTKLRAHDAPDVFELNSSISNSDVLRYFRPLDDVVGVPNPYNAGTPLADADWRSTFWDGISSPPAYDSNYAAVMGVPGTISTSRLFVNERVWDEMTDSAPLPANWQDLVAAGSKAMERSRRRGEVVFPLAVAGLEAQAFMDTLIASQTQRLALDVEPTLRREINAIDAASALVAGRWSMDDQPVLDALAVTQQFLTMIPPGALQLRPEDALFLFTQERAMVMPGSSFAQGALDVLTDFSIVVVDMPMPDHQHPEYGRNVLGPSYEASRAAKFALAVRRSSPRSEQAIDFLRYLTSVPGATEFTAVSGWLPAIVGVEPVPAVLPFMPANEGYPTGFSLTLGGETGRVLRTRLHRLSEAGMIPERFVASMADPFFQAAVQDVRANIRNIFGNSAIHDTTVGVEWLWAELDPENRGDHLDRLSELSESQIFQEETSYRRRLDLHEGGG